MSAPRLLLHPESLRAQVGHGAFEQGLAVYRNQQVLECSLTGVNSREWSIDGTVRGNRRDMHDLSVTLEASAEGELTFFSGRCSCPQARNCQHCVALVLKASYKPGAKPPSPKPEAGTEAAAPREPPPAQRQAVPWQDLFGQDMAPGSRGLPSPPDQEQVLVFTLGGGLAGPHPVLRLGCGWSHRLRHGAWDKLKPLDLDDAAITPQDIEIVRLVRSLAAHTDSPLALGPAGHRGLLTGESGTRALQSAASTGRLFFSPQDRVVGPPLRWGPVRPLSFSWHEIHVSPPAGTEPSNAPEAAAANALAEPLWALQPLLGGAQWFASTPPLYVQPDAGLCGPLALPGVSAEHLHRLLTAAPIPQSAFAHSETTFLRGLAGLPLPPVRTPPGIVQGIAPRAHLHITPVAESHVEQLGLLRATLRFEYGALSYYALEGYNPVLIEQAASEGPGTRQLLYRDLLAERRAHLSLHALGLSGDPRGQFYRPFSSRAQQQPWLQWLDDGFAALQDAGFTVTADPQLSRWLSRAEGLEVQMASGGDGPAADNAASADDSHASWFKLSLGMSIDGQRRNILPLLPELLAQLGQATHEAPGAGAGTVPTVQLPPHVYLAQEDGSYLRLPTEPLRPWLQALLELVGERGKSAASAFDGDALRLSRFEALRVGASLSGTGDGTRWQGADSLRDIVSQLAGRSALPEVAAPEGLKATLRPYQQQGLVWLQFLRSHGLGGILADDMGLGKTLQTLAHILVEKQAGRLDLPVLIMAPLSLMGNWQREAARFTPALRTLVLHGHQRHRAASRMARHDIVIAPYSLLQRDRERWQQQAWHLVVLDEAQNIKNANTHAAQIVGSLTTRHRLCLSGTPMENHLGELWSLFHFLMPGFLGSQARFKALYRTPIEKYGDAERAEQLRRRITPFMLRRHKRDVATDLPDKQEAITSVELGTAQADLYETIRLTTEKTVRDALANKGLAKSHIQILDALLKLRQVCCDPRLVALPAAQQIKQSAKLELLMEMLPELLAEGRKVLLFSQFTTMLALIEQELEKRGIAWVKLTGQSQQRDALIEKFTSGQVPLFLISLKAGGVGLNLTQADTVIHYDPWWNPAAQTQATDRAHRIGQTQPVMVYKLVAEGTIEERILALQERKAALAQSMYSGAAGRKEPLFTESDLEALLQPLGNDMARLT